MAALNFEESDKKSRDILDLRNVSIQSESELRKWLERIPDFKIRLEKIRPEDVIVRDETLHNIKPNTVSSQLPEWTLPPPVATTSKTTSASVAHVEYPFLDPVPASMKDVSIRELGRVNINWRMLTVARPKTKLEEDIFSRLVQLEKLKYKTIQWEYEQEAIKERKGNPRHRGLGSVTRNRGTYGRGGSSRSAVTETRRQTCKECGEEFCLGTCKKYLYDDHSRTLNPLSDDIFQVNHQKITKKGSKKATANAKSSKVDDKATSEGGVDIEADQVETAAATVEPTNNSNVGETSSGVGQLETANERRSSIKSTSRESKGAKPKVHRAKKVTKRKKETDGGK